MPLSGAERQKRRIQKLKDDGKYEEYKKKNAAAKRSRNKKENCISNLAKSKQAKLRKEICENVKKRVTKCRALKRVKISFETNASTVNYKTACALGKATARAKRSLPMSPHRKKAVIKKLFEMEIENNLDGIDIDSLISESKKMVFELINFLRVPQQMINNRLPVNEIQVLQPQQVQHLYLPQQQMVYSNHLSGSTLQNVSSSPGVQAKDSKAYMMPTVQHIQRTFVLQPKQPHYSPVPVHSSVQVMHGNNLAQIPQRQIISAQSPGAMYNQHQMLGQYSLTQLPPGYAWASTSYSPQNPFIIRTPQPNIYVQHPQPPMAMHMSLPVHTPQQALTPANYSEIYQEAQTINSETLISSASQSISCSSASVIVPSNVSSTMSPIHQPIMYSMPPNHNQVQQYSQSFITNQTNQTIEPGTQSSITQTLEPVTHNPGITQNGITQSIEHVAHNPEITQSGITQSMEPVDHNAGIQSVTSFVSNYTIETMDSPSQSMPPIEPIVLSKMNPSSEPVIADSSNLVIADSSGHYTESQSSNPAVQYLDTPSNNEAQQPINSGMRSQGGQSTESPDVQLNHNGESQIDQCAQQSSFLSNSEYSKQSSFLSNSEYSKQSSVVPTDMKDGESKEMLNKALPMKYLPQGSQQIQEKLMQKPGDSSNKDIPSAIALPIATSTTTNSTDSTPVKTTTTSSPTSKEYSKPPLKTYSYTVVSPSSTSQSDNNDDGNSKEPSNNFYPIIKLKRLKPQDPLGKPDSTDKHPQKAIVKPQMLAPPPTADNFQLTDRSPTFPETLKICPTSPEILPLKKRKHFAIENDGASDTSPNFSEPISPIAASTDKESKIVARRQLVELFKKDKNLQKSWEYIENSNTNSMMDSCVTLKRGRGRPRSLKHRFPKTPGKSKTPDKSKSPVKTKTTEAVPIPIPVNFTPAKPKEEVVENSPQRRTSSRRKAKIEVIEIVDDNDNLKMEIESPKKKRSSSTSRNSFPNKNSKTQESLSKKSSEKENKGDLAIASTSSSHEENPNIKLELSSPCKKECEYGNHDLKALTAMSVQEVCDFVNDFAGCSEYGDVFKSQEIDGQALLLLNLDHLMTGFCMRLGPAVKMISYINSLKEEEAEEE